MDNSALLQPPLYLLFPLVHHHKETRNPATLPLGLSSLLLGKNPCQPSFLKW